MFSVTNTGLNTFPLCTLKVSPTKSGVIIDRRDQVLIGALDLVSLAFWIFSSRWPSINGPFLMERPILKNGGMEGWSGGGMANGRTNCSSTHPAIQQSIQPVFHRFFMGRPSRRTRMKRFEYFFL